MNISMEKLQQKRKKQNRRMWRMGCGGGRRLTSQRRLKCSSRRLSSVSAPDSSRVACFVSFQKQKLQRQQLIYQKCFTRFSHDFIFAILRAFSPVFHRRARLRRTPLSSPPQFELLILFYVLTIQINNLYRVRF